MCAPDSRDCSIGRHYITEPGSALIFLSENFIVKYKLAFTTLCWDYFLGTFLPHKTWNSSGVKAMSSSSLSLCPCTCLVPPWEVGGDCGTLLLLSGRQVSSWHWIMMASTEQGAWTRPSLEVIKGWIWILEGLGRTQAMSVMDSTDVSCRDNSVLIASSVVSPEMLADNKLSRAQSLVSF